MRRKGLRVERADVFLRLVGVGVAAALVASCASAADEDRPGSASSGGVEVTGDVSGEVTVSEQAGAEAPASELEGVEAITPVLEVATDGSVDGEVQIRVPLDEPPEEGDVLFALTAEDASGPWELLPAEMEGDTLVVTATHFSLFQAFKALTGAVVDLARESLNSITGNAFAEASPPTCDDEDGARGDGYEIASDDGDTVYWCFGRDDGGRYLRIVNNRRYALLLDYSAGLSVLEQSQVAGEFVERLSQALTLDHQVSVFPRDEVTLRVEPDAGATATVSTQFDGVGSALTQLWVGANTLFAILNRFGAGPPAGSSEAWRRLIGLLDNVDCLDVVGTGNPGSIIAACFDLDALRDTFGLAGAAILAPVAFTGSLASFFQSQLNALGDQLNHRDRYTISISAPAGPVAADGTVELRDQGLGPLTIGMTLADAQATGWVGDELTSCSERLFGEPEGGEQNFALNGPNAPATLAANGVFFAGVLAEIDAWGGVSVGGVLELNDDLDPYDAADTLSSAGYTTEVTTIFEPDDYLNATEADGDTLSMFFQDGPAAGLPQLTTCD